MLHEEHKPDDGTGRKMVESGRVPGNGRIGACPEKLSLGVPENGRIPASIEKW